MRFSVPSQFALVACLLLASQAQAASSCVNSDEQGRLSPVEAEAITLLRTLRDPSAPGPQVVGPQIQKLGPLAIERLLVTLVDRSLPDPVDPKGASQILSEPQTEAILLALSAHGHGAVMPRWTAQFHETPEEPLSDSTTAAALQSLGAFGLADDLETLWEFAGVNDEPLLDLSRPVSANLESAVAGILSRDVGAFYQLEATWSRLPDSWYDEIIRAVGSTHDSEGQGLYTEMVRMASKHQRLVASQIPLLGPSNDPDINARLAQALLGLLQSESKEDVQAGVLAVAVLEDTSILPDLIELLEDPRQGVPQNTHRALCVLTGESFTPNHALWSHWYKEELAWSRSEQGATLARLDSSDVNVVLAALREISRHSLNRHELAGEVVQALTSHEQSVRIMATQVLSELGSRWGAQDLVMALADESEVVRSSAHAALVRITGTDRGPFFEDWQENDLPARAY